MRVSRIYSPALAIALIATALVGQSTSAIAEPVTDPTPAPTSVGARHTPVPDAHAIPLHQTLQELPPLPGKARAALAAGKPAPSNPGPKRVVHDTCPAALASAVERAKKTKTSELVRCGKLDSKVSDEALALEKSSVAAPAKDTIFSLSPQSSGGGVTPRSVPDSSGGSKPSSCNTPNELIGRFDYCESQQYGWSVWEVATNGAVRLIGNLDGTIYSYFTTDRLKREFTTTNKFYVNHAWGNFFNAQMSTNLYCSDLCSVARQTSSVWGTVRAGYNYYDTFKVSTSVIDRALIAQAFDMQAVDNTGSSFSWDGGTATERCDKESYIKGANGGCVLPDWVPTFPQSLSDTAVDEAVEVDLEGQWNITNHPGANYSNLQGVPMHRVISDAAADENRKISCPDSIPRPTLMSCDEYAYAHTQEGAGRGWGYVSKIITAKKNSTQGSRWVSFMNENRVLDGEAFWVGISA